MPAFSTNDNRYIRDGNSNLFQNRMKDISTAQDGSIQRSLVLASPYPVDYGAAAGVGGCYQHVAKSGSMAAGLASNAPIFSMRHSQVTPSVYALLRRVRVNAWSLGTGFTAGIATFDLYVARAFTASDTGGTADTAPSRLRSAMAGSVMADIRHSATATLSAGTRTLDTNPIATWSVGIGTGTNTMFSATPHVLIERMSDHHPLLLANNEGIVIQATVPATGLWSFSVTAEWDEVALALY